MNVILISDLRLFNRATTRVQELLLTKSRFTNKFCNNKQPLLVSQRLKGEGFRTNSTKRSSKLS